MNYDLRLACDTFYFGLSVDDLTFKWLLDEIKNYLFFPLTFNYNHSRSKYYQCEAVNEDVGFFLFFSPHKKLLNDYATVQVTGKYFIDVKREEKLEELFNLVSEFITFQRIDVCLDVLWRELPLVPDGISKTCGFPFPSYSERWKNVRLPFSTYGRFNGDDFYLNMVSCGKSDVRLRVYDKSLEIYEKNKMTYSQYYGFDEEYSQVFRIEYQLRGKALKEFMSNCFTIGIDISDLKEICAAVMGCVFFKFDFLYLDTEAINPFYIPTSCKRFSTLEGRIEFHKNKSGFHYFRYRDLVDEIEAREKEKKQVKKLVDDSVKDSFKELKTIFDFDLEKYSRSEFQDVVKDIPF